jgi:hypothetical protein
MARTRARGPRKPRDYKAEYARRIARKMAAGASRQAARGHKPREHVARKTKFEARLAAFAEQQAARWRGGDPVPIEDALRAQIKLKGQAWLGVIERQVRRLEERYRNRPAAGAISRGIGVNMDDLSEQYELPVETFGYH